MNDRIAKLMENPRKGLFTLAWPMIVSTLFSALLNFTDFFFVGGLGPDALAAVQLSFPIFFLLIALGSGITIGTTSLIARRLGEKNKLWAEETAMHAILLAAVVSVVFTILGFFAPQIASGLGGSPGVSALAADYIGVLFFGNIVFFLSFTMSSIHQAEGDSRTVMKLSITFTIANIILDPIFIYTLGMGVKGAAIATVLAEVVALVIYFWRVFVARKTYLQVKPREFKFTPKILTNIMKVGIPAAFSQISLSIAVAGVNLILAGFGDKAISAYGAGFRIDSLAIMPVLGIGAGLIPMVGYYRGAKDYAGARKVYRLGIKIVLGITSSVALFMLLTAGFLPTIFTSDTEVSSMATQYLMIMALGYPFIGMAIILAAAFQGLGRGMPSLVITLSRAVFVALPLSYFLAVVVGMGLSGVWIGLLVSAFTSAIVSFIWIESILRGLCSKCK